MELDEYINNLENFINNYDVDLRRIVDEVALNAIALIIQRIQSTGLKGGRRYSTRKLPTFYFDNKALNGGGRELLNRRKKKDPVTNEYGISYEEWRKANGLQTAFVDLTYSGKMFEKKGQSYNGVMEFSLINIIERYQSVNQVTTVIGALDKETEDKLRWNMERFGDFLAVTTSEKEMLDKLFEIRLRELYKKYNIN